MKTLSLAEAQRTQRYMIKTFLSSQIYQLSALCASARKSNAISALDPGFARTSVIRRRIQLHGFLIQYDCMHVTVG